MSVSLHAPDNNTRDKLMPVNKKYPLEEVLLQAIIMRLRQDAESLMNILLSGGNDSRVQAEQLDKLMTKRLANMKLIPFEPGCQNWF